MGSEGYFNPYSGCDFFRFIGLFFQRLFLLFSGQLSWSQLAADEVQIFVLMFAAASCGLVGTFLLLRKTVMLANTLSHTILLGIVIAYLIMHASTAHVGYVIDLPMIVLAAVLTGIVTTFLTEFFTKVLKLQSDASNGIIFIAFFSLGVILITLFTRDMHVGTEIVMGNVDALQRPDIYIVLWTFLANAGLVLCFLKEYTVTTFDPRIARSLGISVICFNYLLMIQVSATAIAAFRVVGVVMVLNFIVGLPLIGRLLTHRLRRLLPLTVLIGVGVSIVGVACARHALSVWHMPLSTAGLTVCVLVLSYVGVLGIKLVVRTCWRNRTISSTH